MVHSTAEARTGGGGQVAVGMAPAAVPLLIFRRFSPFTHTHTYTLASLSRAQRARKTSFGRSSSKKEMLDWCCTRRGTPHHTILYEIGKQQPRPEHPNYCRLPPRPPWYSEKRPRANHYTPQGNFSFSLSLILPPYIYSSFNVITVCLMRFKRRIRITNLVYIYAPYILLEWNSLLLPSSSLDAPSMSIFLSSLSLSRFCFLQFATSFLLYTTYMLHSRGAKLELRRARERGKQASYTFEARFSVARVTFDVVVFVVARMHCTRATRHPPDKSTYQREANITQSPLFFVAISTSYSYNCSIRAFFCAHIRCCWARRWRSRVVTNGDEKKTGNKRASVVPLAGNNNHARSIIASTRHYYCYCVCVCSRSCCFSPFSNFPQHVDFFFLFASIFYTAAFVLVPLDT